MPIGAYLLKSVKTMNIPKSCYCTTEKILLILHKIINIGEVYEKSKII